MKNIINNFLQKYSDKKVTDTGKISEIVFQHGVNSGFFS